MAWTPARDIGDTTFLGQSPDWQQIQSLYDEAMTLGPLPRGDWSYLKDHYILERRGQRALSVSGALTALPPNLAELPLGLTEIDFLDFIVNYKRNRVLRLIAPRGAGKTSFLHYVATVIERSSFEPKPIFLIFGNLEKLGEEAAKTLEDDCRDLCELMAGELGRQARNLTDPFSRVLGELSVKVRRCTSPSEVRECFRTLKSELSSEDLDRLVLVFDNLDHLDAPVITLVLDLARAIYLVSDIACIVCLRPNCLVGVAQRGDARAFFNYEISIPPPSVQAWMTKVGERMSVRASARLASGGNPLIVSGQPISPEQLQAILDRFVALLTNRHAQDDVMGLLQTLCADDTRHLRILFRRLLANRSFPLQQLLNGEKVIEYHPIPAMLNGYNLLYKNDDYVPNLLCRYNADNNIELDHFGSPDFLIFHRILRLLDRGTPELVGSLVSMMDLLDFPRENTLGALETLYGPLLIRGTDQDRFSNDDLPTAVYLTEAGRYYLRRLLSNADYLLTAVFDLHLRHKRMDRSYEKDLSRLAQKSLFIERLDSLFEYAEEVANREVNQVARLSSETASSALRRIADSLRYDGLLLSSLCHGLEAAMERSWYSRITNVREAIEEYSPRFIALRETEGRLFEDLRVIATKQNSGKPLPSPINNATRGQMSFSIVKIGDDLTVDAEMSLERSTMDAVCFLEMWTGNQRSIRTAVARPIDSIPRVTQSRLMRVIAHFGVVPNRENNEVGRIGLGAYVRERTELREAFLTPEVSDGKIKLKLLQTHDMPEMDLSDFVPVPEVVKMVQDILSDISGKTVEQKLRIETIQTAGSKLARQLLNSQGMNTLATLVEAFDRIVILSAESDVIIPFEWLRPIPQYNDTRPIVTLAERCSVIRFPLHSIHYHVVRDRDRQLKKAKLCTIGLRQENDKPWRHSTPSQYSDLKKLLQDYDVVHVIAHRDEKNGQIKIRNGSEDLELSEATFFSHAFCGPDHSIILSVCKIGSLDRKRNVGRILAEYHRSAVWTPLVSILESDAERMDLALSDYLGDSSKLRSLDDFFLNQRGKEPFAHVYTRYGV